MPAPQNCAECGSPVPNDVPGSICPACAFDAALALTTGVPEAVLPERIGNCIDRYKLLKRIGEGGWGIVYLAEQTDPIRRQVALKVVKLGMDTRQVIARFEAERQALALMNHPNIAKVHDAGATETGRPYFVMELVDGIKLTDFCDQDKLSTQERLHLFIQVCEAIQHAHQKGIIHRDIKPSNILVAHHNGLGVPKVIDFGIAKATAGQLLTSEMLATAREQLMATPAYMSPEQAELGGPDIDTRTDVYSLGALLYELLTGQMPFDKKTLEHLSLDDVRRMIREHEPLLPSIRFSTLDPRHQLSTADHRRSDPQRLLSLVRGDLDCIVAKALDKDRNRRYETPSALAADLQRFLRNEPVAARSPSNLYRLKKLLRRHKIAVTAAASVLLALLVGLGVSTMFWAKERTARKQARAEATKSRQVAQFFQDMLKGVGPSVALGRDTTILRDILDRTAMRIATELTNQPIAETEIRATIGDVYLEVAEYTKAESMHRASLKLARDTYGEEHPEVATAMDNVAITLYRQSKFSEASDLERKALAMRIKLLGENHAQVAMSMINLAAFLLGEQKLPEAETVSRNALIANKRLYGNEHPYVIAALNCLGCVLTLEGKLAQAEEILREVLALQRKTLPKEHPDITTSLQNIGKILADEGKTPEAEVTLKEALALRRKLLGNEHPDVAQTLDTLAGTLQDSAHLTEAERMYREALAIRKKSLGDEHADVALSINNLANVLEYQDRFAEAESAQREALALQRKLLGNEHPDVAISLNNLARLMKIQRKFAESEPMAREALAIRRKRLGNEHLDVASSLEQLAEILSETSRVNEAELLSGECLKIREKNLPNDWLTFAARSGLGDILLAQKKYAQAEPLLVSAYDAMHQRPAALSASNKAILRKTVERLIRLYQESTRPSQADEWKQRLADLSGPSARTEPAPIPEQK